MTRASLLSRPTRPVLRHLAVLLASIGLQATPIAGAAPVPSASVPPAPRAGTASPPVDLSPVPARHGRSTLPDGWQHGAFMEIFVRAYQDSDGDGIGDLRGLISRLDYLQALGIRGLWLMPIQASADHDHGYATVDFRRIEPQYGSLDDFDDLIREAHHRGIGVVMDYILNHGAREHPLFQAALADAQSPWRDWFIWTDQPLETLQDWDIWGHTPWYLPSEGAVAAASTASAGGPTNPSRGPSAQARYFAVFGAPMPDFNMRNPAVVRYHEDSLRFWLNRGLDGYRLDAVPHLIENNARDWNDQPESRALTGRFTRLIQAYPRRHVVCEATAEPRTYARPEICGSAFAFGLERAVIDAAKGAPPRAAEAVKQVARFFTEAPLTMATMLSNHDIFAGQRAWDQFAGNEARYRLAAATYLLLPGTPFIYYGEEIGQAGVTTLPGDEPLRAPMSWEADGRGFSTGTPFRPLSPNAASHNAQAQEADPTSLLHFYRTMLQLRNTLPSIARGRYEAPMAEGEVLAFQRAWKQERTLVVINYGREAATLTVPSLRPGTALQRLHPKDDAGRDSTAPAASAASASLTSSSTTRRSPRANSKGEATLPLPPQSVQVYLLQ
ncbi:alpha-amylase family glycosyl hydrolase [Roseateles amylovorans]|uniref:Alpha-amylase family glycosyl hydrolase n=1 Tax=Roseateles amylovorans TaxID=2978473 RepID=A0ABY6ASY9_9BURK|nr:alpha-amylase family glycosyl hydrolase [Roseateles amylovorans]UXH76346.1 alpha-amylase family glycosyl hydrolase [Roseateles amylovorans]